MTWRIFFQLGFRPSSIFDYSHGRTLQADVLDVALLIRLPGEKPEGQRVSSVSRSSDVLPTLVALANFDLPDEALVLGQDLTPLLTDETGQALLAYSHSAPLAQRPTRTAR